MTMTRDEAAAVLGMKTEELRDVEDSPAGVLLTTIDGCRFILVPEDQPDAAGNSGLMLLVRPNDTGDWPMPVFAQPGVQGDEAEADDGQTIVVGEPAAEPAPPADPEPAKGKGIRSKAD